MSKVKSARAVDTKREDPQVEGAPDPIFAALGNRVRSLREGKGLSQREFARKAGMNPDFAWRVEDGRQNLSLRSLGRIAVVLEVSLSHLFEGVEAGPSLLGKRRWQRKDAADG